MNERQENLPFELAATLVETWLNVQRGEVLRALNAKGAENLNKEGADWSVEKLEKNDDHPQRARIHRGNEGTWAYRGYEVIPKITKELDKANSKPGEVKMVEVMRLNVSRMLHFSSAEEPTAKSKPGSNRSGHRVDPSMRGKKE